MPKHTSLSLSLLLLLTITISSCVDSIRFRPPLAKRPIVVYGKITTHPGPIQVRVSQTSPFGSVRVLPEKEAEVIIFDDMGNEERFLEIEEGVYETLGEIVQGEVGHSYFIEIRLASGDIVRSRPETILPVPSIDSLHFTVNDQEQERSQGRSTFLRFIDVFLDTPIPDQEKGPYLRWQSEDAWSFTERDAPGPFDVPKTCYRVGLQPNPQGILLFDGDRYNTTTWQNQYLCTRLIDATFTERHYFLGLQFSMTREALDYWVDVDRVSNQQGSIFDAPPAVVAGNLFNVSDSSDQVFGFFEANAVDTAFMFTLPQSFAPFRLEPFCAPFPWSNPPRYPEECYNCFAINPEFIVDRPYYWGE